MEVDVLADGTLDLEDELLEALDLVVVAIHGRFGLDRAAQTRRVLRALAHPAVDVLAHPTGRLLGRREPLDYDMDAVLASAREHRVALECNAHPHRLDLKDTHMARARELGIPIAIDTDAHRVRELGLMRYGVEQARRAWLEPKHVLNARTLEDFEAWRKRRR
jgi:DNA polymerase (family 10)